MSETAKPIGVPPGPARALAALAVLGFCVAGTTSGSLANSTDAIYAIVASDIAERGAWLVPEVAGGEYLMKPPLYFWAVGIAVKILGPTAFAFRLPGVLSGWLLALLCAGIVGRLTGRAAGWYAGLACALLSPTVFEYSRRVFMEETLGAAMLLALYAAIRAHREDDVRWLWLVGLASSVAILTKSYGGGFCGVAVVLWLPLVGRARWLLSKPFLGGIAVGAVPILAYVGAMMAVAPEPFLHQNLLPFRMGEAAQFSWYRTGRFFYFSEPLKTDTIVFLGGLVAFCGTAWLARTEQRLRGVWLLGAYVAVGHLVWGSLAQQRLYYLVPFLPAFACVLAAGAIRLAPEGIPTTAVLALAFGLIPLVQAPRFSPTILDPEPALAELGEQVRPHLGETDVVYRYNDFFATTELYFDRRGIGLTPSEEMLSDFGRILVLGERDIARDGRPAALYALYWTERDAGRPVHLVVDERSMGLIRPGMPELKPWLRTLEPDGSALWFASTDAPPVAPPEIPATDPVGFEVALEWLLSTGRADDATALVLEAQAQHGDELAARLGARLQPPPPEPEPPPEPR